MSFILLKWSIFNAHILLEWDIFNAHILKPQLESPLFSDEFQGATGFSHRRCTSLCSALKWGDWIYYALVVKKVRSKDIGKMKPLLASPLLSPGSLRATGFSH